MKKPIVNSIFCAVLVSISCGVAQASSSEKAQKEVMLESQQLREMDSTIDAPKIKNTQEFISNLKKIANMPVQQYQLNVRMGHVMALQLPANEKLVVDEGGYLAIGDRDNWMVSLNGDTIFISPNNLNIGTNLIIQTDKQLHNLKLTMNDSIVSKDVVKLKGMDTLN